MEVRHPVAYLLAALLLLGVIALALLGLDEGGAPTKSAGAGPADPPQAPVAPLPEADPGASPTAPQPSAADAAPAATASDPQPTSAAHPGGLISGRVVLPDGRPAAGASIRWAEGQAHEQSTRADADGAYALRWPAEHPVFRDHDRRSGWLIATSSDGSYGWQEEVELEAAGFRWDNMSLPLSARCGLTVVLAQPQSHVKLQLLFEATPAPLASAFAEGSLEPLEFGDYDAPATLTRLESPALSALAPGRYALLARCSDADGEERIAWATVTLGPGEERQLQLTPAATQEVTVELRHQGHPAPGLILVSSPPGEGPSTPVLRATGLQFEEPEQEPPPPPFELEPFEFDLDRGCEATDTNSLGRARLSLTPGRWRIQGLIHGLPGRAEAMLEVRPGLPAQLLLEVERGSSATVRYPRPEPGTKFAALGPPGLCWRPGAGLGELRLDGLLPGDRAHVVARRTRSEGDEELYELGEARVSPGAQVTLGFVPLAELEVTLRADVAALEQLNWRLRVESLEKAPAPLEAARFVTVARDDDIVDYGEPEAELRPAVGGAQRSLFPRSFTARVPGGRHDGRNFELRPGRYRVSLEGWRAPIRRELTVVPGEQTLTLRLE